VSLILFILVVVGVTANFLALTLVRQEETQPVLFFILLSDR
jgi:hypothetical protein